MRQRSGMSQGTKLVHALVRGTRACQGKGKGFAHRTSSAQMPQQTCPTLTRKMVYTFSLTDSSTPPVLPSLDQVMQFMYARRRSTRDIKQKTAHLLIEETLLLLYCLGGVISTFSAVVVVSSKPRGLYLLSPEGSFCPVQQLHKHR